jgi:hypothetical protein
VQISGDRVYEPAALTIRRVVAQTERGSLIVLHENLGGSPVAGLIPDPDEPLYIDVQCWRA